jgi:hypothetical protein
MQLLLTPAALLLHCPAPPEGFWPQTLAGLAQSVSGIAVVVGGIWALRNYFHTQRLKSAEILLQMEVEFRVILPTYEMIDDERAFKKYVEPALDRLHDYVEAPTPDKATMTDEDLKVITDLDRCLRFFVLCAVLNKDLGVEGNALLRSYYYHTALLAEISNPEAAENEKARRSARARAQAMQRFDWYLREFYPRLCKWVHANHQNLIRLRGGKNWRKELEPRPIDDDD